MFLATPIVGAQSEQECRKLINDFNLLLTNRKVTMKDRT